MKRLSLEKQMAIAKMYLDGANFRNIMDTFNVSDYSICREINEQKLQRTLNREPYRKKSWNIDFFTENTEITAYWAGFLMADGCLSAMPYNSFNLSLELNARDMDHLIKFCKSVRLDPKYITKRKNRNAVCVTLTGKKLGEHLRRWGICQNKTYEPITPYVEDKLLPHFLRGWFDGDGNEVWKKWQERFRVTGNFNNLLWFASALRKLGFEGKIKVYKESGNVCWGRLVIYGKSNMEWIFNTLRGESNISLSRKHPIR